MVAGSKESAGHVAVKPSHFSSGSHTSPLPALHTVSALPGSFEQVPTMQASTVQTFPSPQKASAPSSTILLQLLSNPSQSSGAPGNTLALPSSQSSGRKTPSPSASTTVTSSLATKASCPPLYVLSIALTVGKVVVGSKNRLPTRPATYTSPEPSTAIPNPVSPP